MILADQPGVIGGGLAGIEAVVEHVQLDLAAEQAAMAVYLAGPELVATLESQAVGGEVTRQGQRRADHDRRLAAIAR